MTIDSPKQEKFSSGGAIWVVFLPALVVVVVAVVLSLMFSPPEPVAPVVWIECTIENEVVFSAQADWAEPYPPNTVRMSRRGNTGIVEPPENGECHIVK